MSKVEYKLYIFFVHSYIFSRQTGAWHIVGTK